MKREAMNVRSREGVRSNPQRERGAVAIMVAFAVVALLAFILLAVQVGNVGTVRGLLQGSADQAALAGARQLNGTSDGLSAARSEAEEMLAGGKNFPRAVNMGSDLDISGSATQTGVWDLFRPQDGFHASTNPDEVNAVQVIARKTPSQNQAVPMFLAGFLGPDTVAVARKAVAVIGSAKSLPCRPELPIAACAEDLTCGVEYDLITTDSNVDNACWTGFFSGANGSIIRDFIRNCATVPQVEFGDLINLNNGSITGPGYQSVRDELRDYQMETGMSVDSDGRAVCTGTGNVFIPDPENRTCNTDCGATLDTEPIDVNGDGVVTTADCGMPRAIPMVPRSECDTNCNQTGPVSGFVLMVITQVQPTGNPKFIRGTPLCGVSFPGAPTGPGPSCSPSTPNACATEPVLVNKDLL